MFTLTINTDNDDFRTHPTTAICLMLGRVSTKLHRGDTSGNVLDSNGNTVGSFKLTTGPQHTFTLSKRKNKAGEYVVRAYIDGKRNPDADYHTDDWRDAESTLADLIRRHE